MSFMNLDENDIYDGYNDFNPSLSNEKYYIQRNDVKNTPINGKELLLRPKTSIVGAGYSNNNNKYSQFVELQNEIPNIGKTKNNQNSMSQNIKKMEQDIYLMLQNSIKLAQEGDITEAISKSEETYRKNKQFNNYKEEFNKDEMINDDIGFMVELNRATLYARNNMHQKALNIYQSIIKMKNSKNTMRIGKIRMNMGNVYYKLGQYGKALKLYKMAMDQIPNGYVSIRMKILHNIGIVQVRLSNYTEASNTFENIMLEKPNFSDAANLIVCYSHLNKISNIQDTFRNMLNIDLEITESDFYRNLKEDPKKNVIYDAIKNDCLSVYERKIQAEAEKCIKFTIQLISSLIDPNSNKGYEWCIQQVKSSNYREMSTDLDIDKAINFLKVEEIDKAIDILKSFELEGDSVFGTASTNLSFIYLMKEEFPNAIKYANIALEHDKYNPYALVNKANTTFQNGNYEQAREMYQEAINNDSTCTEALFNCGLCNKNLKLYNDALDNFLKLNAIVVNDPQIMFNIADIYEKQNDISQAIEWYLQLITVCPSDANVLKRIGRVYELNGDLITACQYYQDAYRYDPSNLDVVIWLEKYYTSSDLHEKSLQFAQKATLICPNHVDYHLIVAQCFRKSGNYQRALEEYKSVHKLFPDNEEALTNLIKICTDMALDDAEHYRGKYDKLIKSNTRRRSHKKSSDGGSSRSYRYDTSETYNYNNNDTNLKTQAVPTYKNDLDESAFDTLEFDQEMLPE